MTKAVPHILLVGHRQDEHCDYLAELFGKRRVAVLRTALDSLPAEFFRWAPGGPHYLGETRIPDGGVAGLWRRPGYPVLSQFQNQYSAFIESECRDSFRGWMETSAVRWLTSPSLLQAAELKMVQLAIAVKLGLSIPDTLVTNSAEEALAFARTQPEVITKAVRYGAVSTEQPLMAWTSVRSIEELRHLSGPPVIIQERITAEAHLRVTTVEKSTFISKLESGLIDWRADLSNHDKFEAVQQTELPDVHNGAQLIAQRFSLGFSAQDWILTPSDDLVFLEANPNGQWLFLEEAHQGAIGQAMVDALLNLATVGSDLEP